MPCSTRAVAKNMLIEISSHTQQVALKIRQLIRNKRVSVWGCTAQSVKYFLVETKNQYKANIKLHSDHLANGTYKN